MEQEEIKSSLDLEREAKRLVEKEIEKELPDLKEISKRGHPKTEIDIDDFEKLAQLGATIEEIADFMGCHSETVSRRMRADPEYSRAYKRGLSHMRLSFRRDCVRQSRKGDMAATIWGQKVYCGMIEPSQNINHNINGTLNVQAARPTSEQLQVSLVKKFEAAGWKMIPPPEEKKDNNDGSGS